MRLVLVWKHLHAVTDGVWLASSDNVPVHTTTVSAEGAEAVLKACRQRPGAAGFEDGTPAYLGISALKHGFAQIERFGSFAAIERHTGSLTRCATAP